MGVFSQAEIEAMDRNIDQLKAYQDADEYMSTIDYDTWASTPEGREELRANAFGKFAAAYLRGERNAVEKLPFSFRSAFLRALNFIKKLANTLRGREVKDLEDIFKSVMAGEKAVNAVNNSIYANQMARLQRISNKMADNENAAKDKAYNDIALDARIKTNKMTLDSGKTMGNWGRYVNSIIHLASKNPFAAEIYDSVRRRLDNSAALLSSYTNALGDYSSQAKDIRYRLNELSDFLRNSGQKATLDEDGYLNYERDGRRVRLANKDMSRQYMQLQGAYGKVLDDTRNQFLLSGGKEFKNLFPEGTDLTTLKATDFQRILDTVDPDATPEVHSRLTNLVDMLNSFDLMKQRDFSPRMRFGETFCYCLYNSAFCCNSYDVAY